ncbi:hypothetical protein [Myxococcus qinghaiensis]|uniref:hypothetical protein n=1 Tax=Myxococcus qinghaiensis TaxID=2906758 RepID=UPI0020A6EA01|nr:hypothetical protein [Myxococcus qinghaiensis]MCP3168247.1 hypothetical protein [Myxococcus qinghaiensis]
MRARHGWVLFGLALAGCGVPPSTEEMQPGADGRDVKQWACPTGVASRLRVITPPGRGPVIISGQLFGTDQLVQSNEALYFGTNFHDGSAVLWRTDGTSSGTMRVKAFPPSMRGPPRLGGLVAVGDQVFFELDDTATGNELWVSDGTERGTRLVKELAPGMEGASLQHLTSLNGLLVFVRNVAVPAPVFMRREVWRSNGTDTGTYRVAVLPSEVDVRFTSLKVGSALHLFLSSKSHGTTLWRTDGTTAGSFAVKRLDARHTYVHHAAREGNLGLFVLDDGPNDEVWKTDGTAAGTVRLESFGRSTSLVGVLGSSVYLATQSTDAKRLHVERVSLSGGGRTRITTLPNPYANLPDAMPYLQRTTSSGGRLYFTLAIGGTGPLPRDVSLWATDGTADGTQLLHHPLDLSDDVDSSLFATDEGTVFFSASQDGLFTEPWFTRGTPATTGQLADINPGIWGSSPGGFARLGSRVYFFASDETSEHQLWSTPVGIHCPPGAVSAQ